MNILVIGASGLTGRIIVKKVMEHNQHIARPMIRKAEHTEAMEKLGTKPILADLEQDFSFAMNDVNAVIFAAGSGSSTGHDKTIAVDQEGAKKAVDFAKEKNIERFIMLSSMGTNSLEEAPDSIRPYLEAKRNADDYLIESGLNFTIVRPGALTNDPGTGRIELATQITPMGGAISREDVAEVLVASLLTKETEGKVFEIINGDTPIGDALTRI
ncbi:SDR family oxidoreductase [Bacillus thermotolerans]|uniref:Conserved protein YhfK n=1 Tax=Bacillus thermotolerans TaxID=1221996 RepID=A0A0F5HNN3_BACTR|nr:SDR family oxidoreductase [Bacillus thermotolerans]KKB34999.1 putative protein YhfK [Bacillus thermotolerans]KKB41842.1 Conserved protein YhfK [Bacillus thermotolerans]